MDVCELWFVLLLLIPAYINSQVTDVKTTGREPYVAQICTNETKTLTLITCKINTERIRGPECNLTYSIEHGFEHGCDSRFRLMKKNQTIFLHLTSLTPEDSGNYNCDCVYAGHTDILHLNISVEEDEEAHESTKTSIASSVVGVTVFIIITGVILKCIHRRKRNRRHDEPLSSPTNMELQDIEPYSTFTQTRCGLYSTVKVQCPNINNSNMIT
ncbi:uncharacterized protein LOC122976373 isoform X1 [Scomber scombrus]|uniref:Uncharacterized protein LOC122976373 isoform X1 n=1 Tax=Scomber scombrus TaxID=13677 RepID=A0AAV1Q1K6_SCOSC